MKVALFTDTFVPQVNGVANAVEQTAISLSQFGHTVRVYAVSKDAQALNKRAQGHYSVFTFPSIPAMVYRGLRATLPLGMALRDVRTFAPDIIHTHTPFGAGWEAVRAARKLGIPLVGTHHTFFDHYLKHVGLDFSLMRKATWRLTVGYYNRTLAVISPTRSLMEEMVKHGLATPTYLIPNTVDTAWFNPPIEAAETQKPVILYLGRLSYEKSVDDVLRAFALIRTQVPATLLIVGDGPERASLEHLASELGIKEAVRFTGFLHGEELVRALQSALLFMSASKSENMPLSVLEAMAVGLPIVVVDSLGMSELLRPGENATLTLPGKPGELAEAALALIADEPRRVRYAHASREHALSFSPEAVIERLLEVYERARRA
jgi:glycosyltransferase involved in cell wall biosynthesis